MKLIPISERELRVLEQINQLQSQTIKQLQDKVNELEYTILHLEDIIKNSPKIAGINSELTFDIVLDDEDIPL